MLNAHPAVVRSAVIGRSVEGTEGGEEIIAFVQLLPAPTISEADLVQYAAQHLAAYKRPSQILLVPSMPVTPTGKIVQGRTRQDGAIRFRPLTTPKPGGLYSGTSISVGPSLRTPLAAPSQILPAK